MGWDLYSEARRHWWTMVPGRHGVGFTDTAQYWLCNQGYHGPEYDWRQRILPALLLRDHSCPTRLTIPSSLPPIFANVTSPGFFSKIPSVISSAFFCSFLSLLSLWRALLFSRFISQLSLRAYVTV